MAAVPSAAASRAAAAAASSEQGCGEEFDLLVVFFGHRKFGGEKHVQFEERPMAIEQGVPMLGNRSFDLRHRGILRRGRPVARTLGRLLERCQRMACSVSVAEQAHGSDVGRVEDGKPCFCQTDEARLRGDFTMAERARLVEA